MTTLRSLGDLLAAVPYLLGFHPTDSLVLLTLRDRRVVFQVRADLPVPAEVPEVVARLTELAIRQASTSAVVLGYGQGSQVTPVVLALCPALESAGVTVLDALRVADGCYWSYLCTEPGCCPPEGRPYDGSGTAIAAEAVVAGCVALPSREELARRLDPVDGPDRAAMTEATRRADERLAALVEGAPKDPAEALLRAGRSAVDRAVRRQRAGMPLDDDELAWLSAMLVYLPVRDHAWESVGGDLGTHVSLWTEVVRRCDPELVAAPATLLAFAAWRAGEGALASIALSRAVDVDPGYQMARLLGRALSGGLSPRDWALAQEPPGNSVKSVDSR
jgi:hypothetical protein